MLSVRFPWAVMASVDLPRLKRINVLGELEMFDEMLEVSRTDQKFRRAAKPSADFDLEKGEQEPFPRQSFGVDYKYILRLRVGTEFVSNEVELGAKEQNARFQLRHAMYKDVISGLHEVIGLSSEPEVQAVAGKMIDQLIGKT